MLLRAPKVMRVSLLYLSRFESTGPNPRYSSMILDVRSTFAGPPTSIDCYNVGLLFASWEYVPPTFVYRALRSDTCHLVRIRVRSLDALSNANYDSGAIDAVGTIDSERDGPLPTACAPIVYWATAESPDRYRTYAVGAVQGIVEAGTQGDTSRITVFAAGTYTDAFDALRIFMATNRYPLVALRRQRRDVQLDPAEVHDITRGYVLPVLLGTQRRRTRRG